MYIAACHETMFLRSPGHKLEGMIGDTNYPANNPYDCMNTCRNVTVLTKECKSFRFLVICCFFLNQYAIASFTVYCYSCY